MHLDLLSAKHNPKPLLCMLVGALEAACRHASQAGTMQAILRLHKLCLSASCWEHLTLTGSVALAMEAGCAANASLVMVSLV